ncbi:MAG: hypothetical protein R2864_01605 [Syntrophotaleaceae bacterium]
MPQTDYLQLLDHLYDGLYFVDTHRKITFGTVPPSRSPGFPQPR